MIDNVPEFPPSALICTPAEWSDAFRAGFDAHERGLLKIPPPGKFGAPWARGWESAWHSHDAKVAA